MRVGLGFGVLLCAACIPGVAKANAWTQTITVEIPPGGLPPGPAVAQLEREGGDQGTGLLEWPAHRIRFEMAAKAMPLRFWPGFVGFRNEVRYTVRARSDTGATWESHGLVPTPENDRERLFVGTADELAAMSRAVHQTLPDEAEDLMLGFELSPMLAPEPACAELTRAKLVVLAEAGPRKADDLRRCAALGASLVVVGSETFGLPDLPSGKGTPWGLGRYGWARSMDRSAADALRDVARLPALAGGTFESFGGSRAQFRFRGKHPVAANDDPSFDRNSILVLLVIYVLALAVVGAWGVRRPKRAVWLWLAFPITAVVASISVAVAGAVTDPEVSHLDVEITDMVTPEGDGLETCSLNLHARAPGTFDVAMPWTTGWLEVFQREKGFQGPFSVDAPPSEVVEDRIQGSLSFPRLDLTHRSDALVRTRSVISGPVPYLRPGSSGGLEIVNPTQVLLTHAAVFADGKRSFVDDVPAGGKKSLPVGKQENVDTAPGWLGQINEWDPDQWLDHGAYMLATASVPTARPSIEPPIDSQAKRIVLTIGPLPGGAP